MRRPRHSLRTGNSSHAAERVPARLDVGLAHEARELLRSIAAHQEIKQLLGVTYTCVNRHVTEGRQALRRAAGAEVEVWRRRYGRPPSTWPDGPVASGANPGCRFSQESRREYRLASPWRDAL
jgi:hypothetical protein